MKTILNSMLSAVIFTVINLSTVTIIFNSNGGSTVPEIQLPSPTSTYEMPQEPIKEGFIFDGWYYDSDADGSEAIYFDENFDLNIGGDNPTIYVYAKWVEAERNVVGLPEQILPNEVFYASNVIDLEDEIVPLAEALPQTNQLPVDYYYVIGGLFIILGLCVKKILIK
jgi:uncharacterized repeat protein (TIGR02543 family)